MKKALRMVLIGLFCLSMFLMFAPKVEAQQSAVDWPMFQHDLSHTGYSASTTPVTNQLLWDYTTGDIVDSSPAVANGVVYVCSWDGNVYALDAATGAQMWNYTIGGTQYWDSFKSSSPAIANGVVYVGSYDNKVYAIGSYLAPQPSSTPSLPPISAMPTTTPISSPVPSPSIPEFPAWIVLPTALAMAALMMAVAIKWKDKFFRVKKL